MLLDPAARTTATLVQASQVDQAVPGSTWTSPTASHRRRPGVALLGMCAALFVATYLAFLRQEVRA